jgi:hypothetical protein
MITITTQQLKVKVCFVKQIVLPEQSLGACHLVNQFKSNQIGKNKDEPIF